MLPSLLLLKNDFGDNFVDWIKILLKNKKSCSRIGGHITKYFKLEKRLVKGIQYQRIFLFLRWKYFSMIIRTNKNIRGLKIFGHEHLYTTYVDDTTFFLEDISSIKVVLKDLNSFSSFSGLCPNFTKCEIAGKVLISTLWYEIFRS